MHTDQMTLADLVRELAATPEVAGAIEASATTFWDILEYGDEAGEIRYSRFLCWLLNPSKDHGLGVWLRKLCSRGRGWRRRRSTTCRCVLSGAMSTSF